MCSREDVDRWDSQDGPSNLQAPSSDSCSYGINWNTTLDERILKMSSKHNLNDLEEQLRCILKL